MLSVRASNCDGSRIREDLKLRIRTLPPWYATWWFRALACGGRRALDLRPRSARAFVFYASSNAILEEKVGGAHPRAGAAQPGAAHRPRQRRIRVSSGSTSRDEYSKSGSTIVTQWFGPCEGRPDLCGVRRARPRGSPRMFSLGMSAMREAVMPVSLCLDQLPKRLIAAGKHFDSRYLPIEEGRNLARACCVCWTTSPSGVNDPKTRPNSVSW